MIISSLSNVSVCVWHIENSNYGKVYAHFWFIAEIVVTFLKSNIFLSRNKRGTRFCEIKCEHSQFFVEFYYKFLQNFEIATAIVEEITIKLNGDVWFVFCFLTFRSHDSNKSFTFDLWFTHKNKVNSVCISCLLLYFRTVTFSELHTKTSSMFRYSYWKR